MTQQPHPTADVSVRVGWADDAPAIAAVQRRAWRQQYADVLPAELLEAMDPEELAGGWADSMNRPGDARNRVLVALERNQVRGYVVTGPSADPDSDPVVEGEVSDLTIDPEHTRAGHGSRLLHACADTLRKDRFTTAVTWVNTTNDALRGFLADSGWAADGASRELDLHGDGSVTVKQVRMHTDLSEE